jgi:hypothetical protein
LDQNWGLQQADHLGPDDLIEQFLSNEALIVANWAAQFLPLSEQMQL